MADWTDEELAASVEAYRDMQRKRAQGVPFVKAEVYRGLASRFGRAEGAYGRRMQNISYLLRELGQEWLPGLAPLPNVGKKNVAPRLLAMLDDSGSATALDDARVIEKRADIPQTTKQQLIDARLGQGRFRADVLKLEPACRVTGVSDPAHLRASHIKPWKHSTDEERLSGSNGLMLAPHIDHLFDRGYISFAEDGRMLVSEALDAQILESCEDRGWPAAKAVQVIAASFLGVPSSPRSAPPLQLGE